MINKLSVSEIRVKNAEYKQSFKGPGTALLTGLKGLDGSPALGACAVDLGSMVIPRTAIEFKNRGQQAGFEAAIREGTSCLIHACVGLIGLGAASLLSGKFNDKYGVKAQNIFANADTIDNMSKMWKGSEGQKQFFETFTDSIKGLNGSNWRTLSKASKEEVVDGLVEIAKKTEELSKVKGVDKSILSREIKDLKSVVLSKITKDTGAQSSFKLAAQTGTKEISASLSELVDNAVVLSNSFKTKTAEKLPDFVRELKRNKVASTALGMGICALMCMSVQPVNRYLTKKRTGQDGFVGVEGKGGDKSSGFTAAKTAVGVAFPIFSMKTIGKFSDLLSNIQFNSMVPTINQFKFLYGLTIGSRFLSARDGNELRESVIKDTLGYTNWLILGGVVSKLVARGLGGKELINNPVVNDGSKKGLKYALKWLTQASVKSYDEVLLPKAKEISRNGKMLKFSELFKKADANTKSKVIKVATSQVAGYLYSGIVLGVGIAKLNIFITKQLEAKKKAKKDMNEQVSTVQTNVANVSKTSGLMKPQSNGVFKGLN